MESDSRSNGSEWLIPDELFKIDYLQQQHKNHLQEAINRVTDFTASGGDFEIKPSHLDLLFGLTAQSLLDNELVDAGITHTVYDTGEERTVTDIMLKVSEAKEKIFEELNIDDQGDWGGKFEDREQVVNWLTKAADTFEVQLREIVNSKEEANG